jgi:hypothetical protein
VRRAAPTIDFVTYDERAARLFAPRLASHTAPEWFKKTPLGTEHRRFPRIRLRQETTIKGCPGVSDYLGLGYVLPLPTDYLVTAEAGGFAWEAKPAEADGRRYVIYVFRPDQWAHFPRREGDHDYALKITTPWVMKTPPGWSTMVLDPWFHRDERFTVIPGVVDTDRYGVLSPILIWHVPVGEAVLLKAGTPLVHLVPFQRGDIESRVMFDTDRWKAMIAEANVVAPDRHAPGAYREHARMESL